jgi:hypothetical protein
MTAVQSRLLRAAKEDEKRAIEEISETMGKQLHTLEESNLLLKSKISQLEKERQDMLEIIGDQTKTLKMLGSRSEKGKGVSSTLMLDYRGTESRHNTPRGSEFISLERSNLYTSPQVQSQTFMRESVSQRTAETPHRLDVNDTIPLHLVSDRSHLYDQENAKQSELAPISPWTSSPAIGILAEKFANDLKPVCQELDELRTCVSVQADRERTAQSRIEMLQTQLAREVQFRKACEANLEHLQQHGSEELERCRRQMEQERLRAAAVLEELERSLLAERSQRHSDGRDAAAHAGRALRLSALAAGLSGELAEAREFLASLTSEQAAWEARTRAEVGSLREGLRAEQKERRLLQQQLGEQSVRWQQQLLDERGRAADVLRDMEGSLLQERAERGDGARRLARGRDAALMLASAAREFGAELAEAVTALRLVLERHRADERAAGEAERRRAAAERRALEQALVRDRAERGRSGLAAERLRAQAGELTRQVVARAGAWGAGVLYVGNRCACLRSPPCLTSCFLASSSASLHARLLDSPLAPSPPLSPPRATDREAC